MMLILSSSLCDAHGTADPFEEAIHAAKASKLTEVHVPQAGIPFYSVKTLDPNWEESGSTPIVKMSSVSLTDQDGHAQNESLFEGRFSIVAFYFGSCSGFCPTLIMNLQSVESKLKPFVKNVQFIGITVDPKRDNVKALKAYSKKMKLSPSWKLLTGDEEEIYSLAHDTFAAEAFKLPKSKGQVSHSEHFYVFDRKKRLRGILKGTRFDVAEKAKVLLTALSAENR